MKSIKGLNEMMTVKNGKNKDTAEDESTGLNK